MVDGNTLIKIPILDREPFRSGGGLFPKDAIDIAFACAIGVFRIHQHDPPVYLFGLLEFTHADQSASPSW